MEVLVVGGDMRSRQLIHILEGSGVKCNALLHDRQERVAENLLMEADIVVLPVNHMGGDVKGDAFNMPQKDIVFWMKEGAKLFCGKADAQLKAYAEECNINVVEFLRDERFQIYNAYLTAEGAVMSAIRNTSRSLINSQCTVIGSGRIADALIHMLRAFTPNIRIVARNLACLEKGWMQGFTVYPIDEMEWGIFGADYVFNTVPARIINKASLAGLKDGSLFMELASLPGGCDKKDLPSGSEYLLESSLPGRVSPIAAANAMCECIYRNSEEIL